MKKLMILMLVLGMATAANAAIVWDVSGNSGPGNDVWAGDTITLSLGIQAGDNSNGLGIGAILDNGAGGTSTGSAVNTYFGNIKNGMDKAGWEAIAGPSAYTLGDRIWMSGFNTTPLAGAATLLTLNYTVNPAALLGSIITFSGVGESQVGLSGANVTFNGVATAIPSLPLNVVPEPMTMVLLGLGGLLIRRKK